MTKYICQKPTKFGDRLFIIGEEIPADLIEPARVKTLVKYGTITSMEVSDLPAEEPDDEPDQPDGVAEESEQPDAEQKQEEKPAKSAKKGGRK